MTADDSGRQEAGAMRSGGLTYINAGTVLRAEK